jgi:hypothetical protein
LAYPPGKTNRRPNAAAMRAVTVCRKDPFRVRRLLAKAFTFDQLRNILPARNRVNCLNTAPWTGEKLTSENAKGNKDRFTRLPEGYANEPPSGTGGFPSAPLKELFGLVFFYVSAKFIL